MMAKPISAFLFFFFIFTIIQASFSGRLQPSTTTTTVLDVSASLQRAHQVLSSSSFTTSSPPQNSTFAHPPYSFHLHIHPRESLLKPSAHKDYRSLVLSRLARDSARVDYLNAELRRAIGNLTDKTADQYQEEGLSVPIISGMSQGSGEYFIRVGIGSPGSQLLMSLDTGSDVSWMQCQPCVNCYEQTDPIFNPSSSSTYQPLSCESQQCQALEVSSCSSGNQCLYRVRYGDGSVTSGELATETVSFGGSGSINNIALGCGHDNEGLFRGSAGLIGLGRGQLSLIGQMGANFFSYCLVHRDSPDSSTLEIDSGARTGSSAKARLIRNEKFNTFYYVEVTGMSVGGNQLPIPSSVFQIDGSGGGGIIVDSGTAITRLQTEAYNILRDAFVQQGQGLRRTSGILLFDTCYDFSSLTSVRVPTVSFQLSGGGSWSLPAENYLIPMDGSGTYCFAFAPTSSPALSIIGNVQQQGVRVSFDLADSTVSFSPSQC
ncbi:hypothetical protein SAY87_003965 [Trapa incisa]|uniref:Peptidase A1 domain-containing protein n=1 Tax=Trapa incisa TaxID=236973 RepID=A0AAN7PL88_9MYRT|nr:hypothetical protein SAY87_003965 [Trapa incisa]